MVYSKIENICLLLDVERKLDVPYLSLSNLSIDYSSEQLSSSSLSNQSNFLNAEKAFNNSFPDFIEAFCSDLPYKLQKVDSEKLRISLIKYLYPVILLLGLFGNLITFSVMIKIYKRGKNFKKLALSLAALSIADLSILIFGCGREYLETILMISIRSSNIYSCKLIYFLCYLFSSFSAYLHAFIACERWNAISRPLKNKSTWTYETNKLLISLIFILCVLFNVPLFWFTTLNHIIIIDDGSSIGVKIIKECEVSESAFMFNIILTLIDSVFYCLIPFLTTILFSSLTLFNLLKPKPFTRNHTTSGSLSYGSNYSEAYNLVVFSTKRNELAENTTSRRRTIKHKSNVKITIMLMSIPISYLITTFPIFVILIHGWLIRIFKQESTVYFDTAYCIGTILMYFDNSINILLYIFLGKGLRRNFISIIPPRLRKCCLHHESIQSKNQNYN